MSLSNVDLNETRWLLHYAAQRRRKANAHGFDLLGILKHRPSPASSSSSSGTALPTLFGTLLFWNTRYCFIVLLSIRRCKEQHPSFKIFLPPLESRSLSPLHTLIYNYKIHSEIQWIKIKKRECALTFWFDIFSCFNRHPGETNCNPWEDSVP